MTAGTEDARQIRIAEALSRDRDAQVHFLAELVKTPSDNPPGDCAPHGERAAALLSQLGFEVERHAVPEVDCRAHGMVSVTNLVVRVRFGDGPTAALNAHGDVVAPGEGWTRDPYGAEVVDGVMYGRGVAVSKSDFATYAFALKALQDSGVPLAGTVELHLTYDEEAGGELGPKWLLDQGISRPDFAISAGFAHAVVNAHSGCLHLEVEVRGRSAHAAMPETGHDALEAATDCLNAIYRERGRLGARKSSIPGIGSPAITVGLIEGGINTNVVPDRVTLRIDRRMIPEEDAETVEAELRHLLATAVAGKPGIELAARRIMLATPLTVVEGTDVLAAVLQRHAATVLGTEVPVQGVPLYTDARHYSNAGVATVVYGAGPRSLLEANAHRADEKLQLSDLEAATRTVAFALCDLLAPA